MFVGGVIYTLSAWVIWNCGPYWLGLEPGRKVTLPLGLLFCYTEIHEEVNKGNTEKKTGAPGNRPRSPRYLPHAGVPNRRGRSLGDGERH
jgi:hypothetical protein